jgi:NADP-dependent 3-hydroxy acid dehydrogenase YdfG
MSKTRVPLDGRTAYVSGAGSGIGRAVSLLLGSRCCPLAIVDQVLSRGLDVRDRQAQMAFAAEVAEWSPGPMGMVFNNAGVTTTQDVADAAPEDDEWVVQVNFEGVVNGTRAFLPILKAQNSGVIVNTSSVFGLIGFPGQSAYCASKFAVRGFTDSLRQELRGTGVSAINVHPGGVKTNVLRNARYHAHPTQPGLGHEDASRQFEAMARTTPERAAEIIYAGVTGGKSRVLVGPDAYFLDALVRLMPTRYYDVIARLEPLVARRG